MEKIIKYLEERGVKYLIEKNWIQYEGWYNWHVIKFNEEEELSDEKYKRLVREIENNLQH